MMILYEFCVVVCFIFHQAHWDVKGYSNSVLNIKTILIDSIWIVDPETRCSEAIFKVGLDPPKKIFGAWEANEP